MATTTTVYGDGIIFGGRVSGASFSSLTVAERIARLDGQQITGDAASVSVSSPGPSYPRIDLVVMSANGKVRTVTGREAASPTAPAVPAGAVALAALTITPGQTAPTISDSRALIVAPGGQLLTAMQVDPTTHWSIEQDPRTGLWIPTSDPVAGGLRTLNSIPIALVTPSATQIVVPTFVYMFVKAGSVVFSSVINIALNIDVSGSILNDSNLPTFNGSADRAVAYDIAASVMADGSFDYVTAGAVGAGLFLTASNDRTGGDGTVLTLLLKHEIQETSGLI